MATDSKSKSGHGDNGGKKRKQRYLPHNKPVKKGGYPLRPGVEGFFITCDGGRERQASHEAINVIDSFYEELVNGKDSEAKHRELPNKPLNKKIKFNYSDSSDEEEDDDEDNDKDKEEEENKKTGNGEISTSENQSKEENKEENKEDEIQEPPPKKQHTEKDKVEEKSIDKLIDEELAELGDKSKRRFNYLDSGCNGVVIVQMRKREGDPSPKEIVQHMMNSIASTKKHISRFLLRVLPVEVSCYASEEEISRAIKPLIAQYFPTETPTPSKKFAVLYDSRANTGIDRMKIINSVAKSVPEPHKVDLNNPDLNIVVQIVKTVCLIGVVEKYKELAKYNLRQLSSSTNP